MTKYVQKVKYFKTFKKILGYNHKRSLEGSE